MGELCRLLRTLRPDVGAPRWRLPKLVTWLTPLFEKRLSFVTVGKLLNGQVRLDSTRSRDELRLDYRDLESTIADCARSLSEHGFSAPAAPA